MSLLRGAVRVGAVVAATAALALAGLNVSTAAVTAPKPGLQFVPLRDSVNPAASHRTGAYRSPRMSVEVTLAPRNENGLDGELRSAYTRGSGGYHQWLAKGQFAAWYAPAAAERTAVASYLRSAGLTVTRPSSPFLVRATGSSQRIESAFRTVLSSYRNSRGVRYFANSAAVRLPSGIARYVLGVVGLTSTVRLHSMLARPAGRQRPAGRASRAGCEVGYPTRSGFFKLEKRFPDGLFPHGYGAAPGCTGLTPPQVNSLYGAPEVGPRGKGAGVTLGLFELSAYQPSDIGTWARKFYGPGYHPRLRNINVDGGPLHPVCPAGDPCPPDINGYAGDGEVDADIETDLAIAPDARRVEVYNAPDDTTGQTSLDEYAAIASQDTADVVSSSWANCENDLPPGFFEAENEIFEQMALQGQSMFSGSGDSGAFSCMYSGSNAQNLMDPAAQPWVTGVGGTSLEGDNPGTNPDPGPPARGTETVWNNDNLCSTQPPAADNNHLGGLFWCAWAGATGGGYSQLWGRPFYQRGPGVNNPAYPNAAGQVNSSGITECVLAAAGTPCREDPDVSADADGYTGYAEYCTGKASLPFSLCYAIRADQPVRGWFEVGGTSLSGPVWAAIIADRDSYQGHRSGNINPWVYALLDTDPGRYFNDVTGRGPRQQVANNNGIFRTTPEYDMATGVGTPRMAALITGS
jgi:subtilase family serine protease